MIAVHTGAETILGRKLFAEIRYGTLLFGSNGVNIKSFWFLLNFIIATEIVQKIPNELVFEYSRAEILTIITLLLGPNGI